MTSRLQDECRDQVTTDVGARFLFSSDDDLKHFHELFLSHIDVPVVGYLRESAPRTSQFLENLPDEVADADVHELEQLAFAYGASWLMSSDAGLLYRTREELLGVREGYERVFWPLPPSKDASTSSDKRESSQQSIVVVTSVTTEQAPAAPAN